MCGIIGYLGKDEALPILIDGLKNLEYRGYDSAGVAVLGKEKVQFAKTVGRVASLEEKISKSRERFSGNLGIAHTRWATHGGVTEWNAHPHFDCRESIFVAHNGIIENFKEIKNKLARAGHKFRSETDTEILPHLIENYQNKKNIPLEEAVRRALAEVRGTYGIAVFSKNEPGKLIAARNFSPLILGIGDGEFLAASDMNAIISRTRNVFYLKDGEIALLEPRGYKVFTVGKEPVRRRAEELGGEDLILAKKGGYEHFMLKEICEQPEAVENSIRGRLDVGRGDAVLGGLRDVEAKLREVKRIHICACGSAYLAGKVGEYMLEEYAGIPVDVDYASEFRYRKPVFEKGDIFLAVSQSGETADTLASLYEAKKKGLLTLGIVNVVGSTLSRETDAGVYQHIGPEIGVAASKSFTSQMSILALLTLYFGRRRGMSLVMGSRIAKELKAIPDFMREILERKSELKKLARKYREYKNFLYLGRKYNFPIAVEGALKIKEIAYVHAEGYAAGEMKHGPIAMIDKNFPTVALAPSDSVYEKMISNIHEIRARGGPVLAIATEGDKKISSVADDVFYIPKTLEMLTPLLSVVPLQLFAYYFAAELGCDIDKPRNLAKSVTVE